MADAIVNLAMLTSLGDLGRDHLFGTGIESASDFLDDLVIREQPKNYYSFVTILAGTVLFMIVSKFPD